MDGFDAAFKGWGREDSDIFIRLIRAGVRRKDGRFATGVLHLWHREADRSGLDANERQLADIMQGDAVQGAARPVRRPTQAAAARRARRRGRAMTMANAATAIDDFRRDALPRIADGLAVAVAASLPWSTSATGILIALWLLAMLPTLSVEALRREIASAPGGLPVLLAIFAAAGMAWADVPIGRALPRLGIVPAADRDPGAARAVSPLRSRAVGRRRVPGVGRRAARHAPM